MRDMGLRSSRNLRTHACSDHQGKSVQKVGTVENGVLFGHRDQLFLVGGGHSILAYTSGKLQPTQASISNFELNLKQRHALSEKRGARYVHVIFPDKQSVLTEAFPFPDPICLGEVYLDRLTSLSDHVVYPRDSLRREGNSCFLHTDTHLSDYGTSLVTAQLLQRFSQKLDPNAIKTLTARITSGRAHCGDLGSKLSPPVYSNEMFFGPGWPAKLFSNKLSRNNGLVDLWFHSAAVSPERVLMFGDSFGRDLARGLSYWFGEVMFLRTPYYHFDIVNQFQPDIIISENAERYLSHVGLDEQRPSFFMFPYLKSQDTPYRPDPKFAEAFSAVLSFRRSPYRKFIAKLEKEK